MDQSTASKYLVSGHVKPVDEDGWTPRKLLGPIIKEDKVKKMFDDIVEPKEPNWATKGVRR